MNPTSKKISERALGVASRTVLTPQTLVVQAFSLVANCLEFSGFHESSLSLVTNLATFLHCERVSIGKSSNGHLHVYAMSHRTQWDKRTNLVKSINSAMDECCDQEITVVYPIPSKNIKTQFARAHEKLSAIQKSVSLLTVPIISNGVIIGAITLERSGNNRFQPNSVQLVELVATIVGPILELKRLNERWIGLKIWDAAIKFSTALIGSEGNKTKYAILFISLFVAYSFTATGIHKVTADSIIEGSVQRTISAADDGYVSSSSVRAGDTVTANQVLAKLDDKNLQLEINKQKSQRIQLQHEYKNALVQSERVKVALFTTKINQIDNELALLDEQLKRLHAVAPFDGIIIEGDLTQALGMPVKRGDVLFKVAPLDDYRVVLNIDEEDIGFIKVNQKGLLTLTGLPNEYFSIDVVNITPISVAREGRNYFQVEATLAHKNTQLRPNMRGVGKIIIGEDYLVWVWTHKLINWLVLHTWSWMP